MIKQQKKTSATPTVVTKQTVGQVERKNLITENSYPHVVICKR